MNIRSNYRVSASLVPVVVFSRVPPAPQISMLSSRERFRFSPECSAGPDSRNAATLKCGGEGATLKSGGEGVGKIRQPALNVLNPSKLDVGFQHWNLSASAGSIFFSDSDAGWKWWLTPPLQLSSATPALAEFQSLALPYYTVIKWLRKSLATVAARLQEVLPDILPRWQQDFLPWL